MEQLRIDLVPMGVTPNAHASQYDVGRVIRFLLYNGGTAYTLAGTETITVKMAKPDGTEETVSVTNTSSNYVDFITTDGLLNQAGLYPCEISITSGTDVIGSKNFNLRVELDPYDGHNIRTVTVGPADICTFTTDLPEFLPSVTVNVLATGGNGTPDNPNPINGYSEANITRCGVNLWESTDNNVIALAGEQNVRYASGNGTIIVAHLKAGYTYTISGVTKNRGIVAYFDDMPELTDITSKFQHFGNDNYSFTALYSGLALIYIANSIIDVSVGQLELGSTATAYTPYNGQTYAIAFGQTVYGGVLDVTRGKLTVTHNIIDMGSINWNKLVISASVTGYQTVSAPTGIKPNTDNNTIPDILCEAFTADTVNRGYTGNNPECITENTSGLVTVYTQTAYADGSAFKTAMTGIEFTYPLATPFDIDLTPVQIRALVGENNVFADCGETEVEYMAEGT